jgi:protein CpxP
VHRETSTARLRIFVTAIALSVCCLASSGFAQDGPPPNGMGDGSGQMGPPPMEGRRPPMERAFHLGPPGRWWNNPGFARDLGLTDDQQKKMEAIFEDNRPKLTDMFGALRKEEANMEPLLSTDQPDETRILAQIDRVAQARAELEKSNARMLLGMRRVLTQDQWKKLQAEDPRRHGGFGSQSSHGGPPPEPNN